MLKIRLLLIIYFSVFIILVTGWDLNYAQSSRRREVKDRSKIKNSFSSSKTRRPSRRRRKSIKAISFSPDSKYIISCEGDNKFNLWNISGKLIRTFKNRSEYADGSLFFDNEGEKILAGTRTGKLEIWDLNGKYLKSKKILDKRLAFMVMSPDRNNILIGGSGRIKLWNVKEGRIKTVNTRVWARGL